MILSSLLWLSLQVAGFSLAGAIVFLLLRRRGPSVGATVAASVLFLSLPLLLVAFSPWPRWELAWASGEATPTRVEVVDAPVELPPLDGEAIVVARLDDSEPAGMPLAEWWQSAAAMFEPPQPAPIHAAEPPVEPHRPTWLLWLLAGGVAFGLVRLVVGLRAVRALRTESQPIDDAELQACLAEVREKLVAEFVRMPGRDVHAGSPECSRIPLRVEVRESSRLRSAATIGWRRPMLLLPSDWRTWTDVERRVVIAHELAHVARRDYLYVLIARLATAIHFYQPLVLWLAGQLRVQQELAADTIAAHVTGSRQAYLTTLAHMALRADEQTIPWPARAFLPGAGLLVKRVRWLKHNKTQEERTMNRKTRWTMYAALAAMAMLVAGIRGPGAAESKLMAEEPETKTEHPAVGAHSAEVEVKNEYVPANAKLVIAVRPHAIPKELQPIATLFASLIDRNGFERLFKVKFADLQAFQLIKTTNLDDWDRVVVKTKQPFDWKQLLGTDLINNPAEKQFNGRTYYVAKPRIVDFGQCAYFADDRTLVLGTEGEILEIRNTSAV